MERFRIEALEKQHNRKAFSCGVIELDNYLQKQVSQDTKKRIARCFVMIEKGSESIAGFYTLSAMGVPINALPKEQQQRIPKYPLIPAVLIGRLAVDEQYQGKGLGGTLIADAIMRSATTDIGAYALIVDVKDDNARKFYQQFGFEQLAINERSLCLPIATALKLMGS